MKKASIVAALLVPACGWLFFHYYEIVGCRYRIERELGEGGMATVYLTDAMVADFGVARAVGVTRGPSMTQIGVAVGTLQFSAGERR